MDRRKLVAGAATGLAMVLLVLTASSGPVRVWITPPLDVGSLSIDDARSLDTVAPQDSVPTDRSEAPPWGETMVKLVGVLVIVLVVTMAVAAVAAVRIGTWPRLGRRKRLGRLTPLPEVPERELNVDMDAARAALAGGSPRNAIVACWMQFERDAGTAGLSRRAAETSAEYVERVVAESSVDPAPIGVLAALYREARFSRHELRDDHRTRAFAALTHIEAALRRGVEVPT